MASPGLPGCANHRGCPPDRSTGAPEHKGSRWRRAEGSSDLSNETLGLFPELRRDHEIGMRLRDVELPVLPELGFGVGRPLTSAGPLRYPHI